jgi:hypothetical protein
MYDLDRDPNVTERRKYFNIKIAEPRPGSEETVNLGFNPVTPDESSNGCFKVGPM